MKAIILAGGKGKRMAPFESNLPKSLVSVKGKPLLQYIIDSLIELDITKIIFLTGYKSEKIQDFLNKEYPDLNAKIIQDPLNHKGSYICSLARIGDLINDDLIFMHGDMLYDKGLLKKLVDNNEKNLAMTHINPNSTGKDFKARIEKGLIKKISVNIKGNLLMPLYKFSKDPFLIWLKSINEFIDKGKIHCYAEEAIEPYANEIQLKPLYYNEELCMEIDDINDLRRVESLIY